MARDRAGADGGVTAWFDGAEDEFGGVPFEPAGAGPDIAVVATLPAAPTSFYLNAIPIVATMGMGAVAMESDPAFSFTIDPVTFVGDMAEVGQLAGEIRFDVQFNADMAEPELPRLRTLGCGVYDVWLANRGGAAIRKLVDVEDIRFTRTLNDSSTADIIVGKGGGTELSDSCCASISDIEPWAHEILIFRGSDGSEGVRSLVWAGPVRRIEIDADAGQAFISCRDLFSWFDRRFYRGEAPANAGIVAQGGDSVPDLDVDETDLSYIWSQVVTDALLPQNPGITVEPITETGTPATRYVSRSQYRYAGDVLRELANSGIDWTMINRTLRAGATEIQTPPIGLLTDEHFAKAPRLIIDGDDMATRWVVGGGGTGQDGPDEAGDTSITLALADGSSIAAVNPLDPTYGLIEQYVFQPEIEDAPGANGVGTAGGSGRPSHPYFNGADNTDASYSIYQAAHQRLSMHSVPYVTIEGGELSPNAPFDFNTLVPGAILRVNLRSGCREVRGHYRLREVSVRADSQRDAIDVRFENLGSTAYIIPAAGSTPSQLPPVVSTISVTGPPHAYFWASWEPGYPGGTYNPFTSSRNPWEVTVTIVYRSALGTPSKIVIPAQISSSTPPVFESGYVVSFEPVLTPGANTTLIASGTLDAFTSYQVWRFTNLESAISGVLSRPYIGHTPSALGASVVGHVKEIYFGAGAFVAYLEGYDDNGLHGYRTMPYRFTA